jgi:hypothetical protein
MRNGIAEDFMADGISTRGVGAATERTTDQASSGGNGFVDKLKSGAATQLNSQKARATDGLGSVVQAVRQSTQQLREQHHDTIARYVEQAADQIDRLSRRLRDKDITQLIGDVQRLSRRQPAAFVGGAFAVGLVAARFFKSSARDERSDAEWPSRSYPAGREYRSYQESVGTRSYSAHDVSRTSDYGSASDMGREPGGPVTTRVGEPGSADTSSERPTGGSRARRGTQTERS